jgi:peptide-methionine (R)-S-oxide reductase
MGKITKTDEEWRRELSPEAFEVTRRAGTERRFSGAVLEQPRKRRVSLRLLRGATLQL